MLLAILALAGCERTRPLGTGLETEVEKQRRETEQRERAEREIAAELQRQRAEDDADNEAAERRRVSQAVLTTCQQIHKVNVEMDREARDPRNDSDYRARQLTEWQYAGFSQIPLQDCPDDFSAAANDFFYSARGFSEYAYTQTAPEIGYVFEILRKGPAAIRLAAKNLKPGPQKLTERYLVLTEVARRYGVIVDEQGVRVAEPPVAAKTGPATPPAAPAKPATPLQ